MRKDELRALLVLAATIVTMVGDNLLLGGNHYYIVSALMMAIALVPFLVAAGPRRRHTRELVFLAFLVLLSALFRAMFIWLPGFKPIAAVIMIAGLAMGSSGGLLVGFWSICISDLFCGFGPWAPWQMLAYGLAGFAAGLAGNHGLVSRSQLGLRELIGATIGVGAFVIAVVGPILDVCSLAMMPELFSEGTALATFESGLPVNATQALAAVIAFFLLANPVLEKLARARLRFGMMDWDRRSMSECKSDISSAVES